MNSKPFSITWWVIALTTISSVLAGIGPIVETLPAEWRGVARSVIAGVGLVVVLVLRSALFDADGDGTPDALERPTQAPPPPTGGSVSARARAAGIVILAFVFKAVFVPLLLLTSGCGGVVSRVAVPVACSSLMLAVGEDHTRTAERAHADIDQVAEVCARFPSTDGGAP